MSSKSILTAHAVFCDYETKRRAVTKASLFVEKVVLLMDEHIVKVRFRMSRFIMDTQIMDLCVRQATDCSVGWLSTDPRKQVLSCSWRTHLHTSAHIATDCRLSSA